MKITSLLKKHWYDIAMVGLFVVLGFLAVFLAGSLYLTRNVSIAPQSQPGAAANNTCQGFSVTFTQTAASASPTESPLAQVTNSTASPTESPTESPTGTATSSPTTALACGSTCTPTTNTCSNGMSCLLVNGSYTCANPSCSEASDCSCNSSSPTPAPTITSSPQPTSSPHQGFECNSTCSSDSECLTIGSGYVCYNTGSDKRCRMSSNLTSSTCATQTTTVSNSSSTTVPSPVANELPKSGFGFPTLVILGVAASLILGSFLLI